MADQVSWLMIETGWKVLAIDGTKVGGVDEGVKVPARPVVERAHPRSPHQVVPEERGRRMLELAVIEDDGRSIGHPAAIIGEAAIGATSSFIWT